MFTSPLHSIYFICSLYLPYVDLLLTLGLPYIYVMLTSHVYLMFALCLPFDYPMSTLPRVYVMLPFVYLRLPYAYLMFTLRLPCEETITVSPCGNNA